jgi:hypothetical protein
VARVWITGASVCRGRAISVVTHQAAGQGTYVDREVGRQPRRQSCQQRSVSPAATQSVRVRAEPLAPSAGADWPPAARPLPAQTRMGVCGHPKEGWGVVGKARPLGTVKHASVARASCQACGSKPQGSTSRPSAARSLAAASLGKQASSSSSSSSSSTSLRGREGRAGAKQQPSTGISRTAGVQQSVAGETA